MAITTYSELQTAAARWINRTDLTDRIVEFISLSEAAMKRMLKTADMEASTTLTCTSGTPTVALPAGFAGIRRLRILLDGVYNDVQIVSLEPSLYNGVTPDRPVVASVVGSNLYLKPTPNSAYTLALDYWAKFTVLSDAAPSNWILASHPDAYLFGTLVQAGPFVGQDPRLGMWADGFRLSIDQINAESAAKVFSNLKLRCDPALVSRGRYDYRTGRTSW